MKKIVLFLLVLFSLNIKVQASSQDVYYSDYSDFSEFVEKRIEGSELIDVETERRYRWYKENITSEYMLYDEGVEKYESVNLEKFNESDFSEWSYEQPNKITGRIVEEKEEYIVRRLKPIQTLMINSFEFSKDMVNLGEMEIYIDDKKVDYDIICNNCNTNNEFQENDFMLIDFYEPYYIKDITIKFIGPEKDYINSFKIYAVEPMVIDVPSNIFASYTYQVQDGEDIVITEKKFKVVNPKYEEEIILDELLEVGFLDDITINTKYRYKDKYYYFYNTELEYADGYYSEYLDYKRDENDYKDFYRYRTREKVVIDNEMTITRYRENLEDFIISTTNYEIESNINYLENGVYSVRFITSFRTISKDVTVDIEDNDLRKENEELTNIIKNQNEEIKELEDINILNEQKLSINKMEYQELLNDYNEIKNNEDPVDNSNYIDSLTVEKENCTTKLNDMLLRNEDNEKKLKLSNQANDYLKKSLLDIEQEPINIDKDNIISFILTGLVIIFLIGIIIKKMSSKN